MEGNEEQHGVLGDGGSRAVDGAARQINDEGHLCYSPPSAASAACRTLTPLLCSAASMGDVVDWHRSHIRCPAFVPVPPTIAPCWRCALSCVVVLNAARLAPCPQRNCRQREKKIELRYMISGAYFFIFFP